MEVESKSNQSESTCICDTPPATIADLFWIACESGLPGCPGNGWYHCVCLGLPNIDHADIVDEYHCPDCRKQMVSALDTPSASPAPDLSSAQVQHNTDDCSLVTSPAVKEPSYAVEAIVDHGEDIEMPGTFVFCCKWKGYPSSDNTWINERHLQMCYRLVSAYRREHDMGPSTVLKAIGGAAIRSGVEHNTKNWVSLDEVMREIASNSVTASYTTDLALIPLDLDTNGPCQLDARADALYVALYECHFIVALYLRQLDSFIVCDSQNAVAEDSDTYNGFCSMLGKRTARVLVCTKSVRADHCGSGAVALSLELLRKYRTRDLEDVTITPPAGVLSKLIKKLHPEPSEPIRQRAGIKDRIVRFTCRKCKKYTRTNKRAMLSHERFCSLN